MLAVSLACGQQAASPGATPVPGGPYPTLDDAEAYVMSQTPTGLPLQPVSPAGTWRDAAVLHVIHATPSTRASSGGDFFYFFVNGDPVGMEHFTLATASAGVNDTTYEITYAVYRPGDPHCCPTGGKATVRFRWEGAALTALDPMPGSTQS
jgi:hypothetical protein